MNVGEEVLSFQGHYNARGLQLLNDMDLCSPDDDLYPTYLRAVADILPRPGVEGVTTIAENYLIEKTVIKAN
ncbi:MULTISPECIES: hypothetical protein [unclassified Paenibacillus]|uniref:hypothetical protein n=1 Tax=unclassified Paenibacillus TaxID=185978 RepID=UPI000715C5DE|nr:MULTISPECIES: hypothetical protein [unclassified Paenibacillus]KRE48493.1 hypothetical protein ASG85_05700 [Paenibacillus sp. Soil724D2]